MGTFLAAYDLGLCSVSFRYPQIYLRRFPRDPSAPFNTADRIDGAVKVLQAEIVDGSIAHEFSRIFNELSELVNEESRASWKRLSLFRDGRVKTRPSGEIPASRGAGPVRAKFP
jgi:hypothetical protein